MARRQPGAAGPRSAGAPSTRAAPAAEPGEKIAGHTGQKLSGGAVLWGPPSAERAPASPATAAPTRASQDERRGRVEPDERVGPAPGDVADRRVVAVDHPGIAGRRREDPFAEYRRRCGSPARTVEQRVELDHGNAHPCRECARKCRLSRTAPTSDHDTAHGWKR